VQVKVKVQDPDEYLRPEMNASVAFVSDKKEGAQASSTSSGIVYAPAAAIRDNAVFVALNGKAVRRAVKTGLANDKGTRIEEGLIGGEELILNPSADLKDGSKIQVVK
jgi:HlyD family secretion protein